MPLRHSQPLTLSPSLRIIQLVNALSPPTELKAQEPAHLFSSRLSFSHTPVVQRALLFFGTAAVHCISTRSPGRARLPSTHALVGLLFGSIQAFHSCRVSREGPLRGECGGENARDASSKGGSAMEHVRWWRFRWRDLHVCVHEGITAEGI